MRTILVIITILFSQSIHGKNLKAIVKVNSIRGEFLSTRSVHTSSLEDMLEQKLQARGIERVYSQTDNQEDIIIVEAFVYQFLEDFPSVTLIIRSKHGFHYYDTEFAITYIEQLVAIARITKKVADRMPETFDLSKEYGVYMSNLITQKKSTVYNEMVYFMFSRSSLENDNSLDWGNNESLEFLFSSKFLEYLNYCIDYRSFRRKLNDKKIVVNIKITEEGRTEVVDIEAPFKLKNKHIFKIKNTIAALPIWITEKEITGVKLNIGINK